jgi:hypothetical protein
VPPGTQNRATPDSKSCRLDLKIVPPGAENRVTSNSKSCHLSLRLSWHLPSGTGDIPHRTGGSWRFWIATKRKSLQSGTRAAIKMEVFDFGPSRLGVRDLGVSARNLLPSRVVRQGRREGGFSREEFDGCLEIAVIAVRLLGVCPIRAGFRRQNSDKRRETEFPRDSVARHDRTLSDNEIQLGHVSSPAIGGGSSTDHPRTAQSSGGLFERWGSAIHNFSERPFRVALKS